MWHLFVVFKCDLKCVFCCAPLYCDLMAIQCEWVYKSDGAHIRLESDAAYLKSPKSMPFNIVQLLFIEFSTMARIKWKPFTYNIQTIQNKQTRARTYVNGFVFHFVSLKFHICELCEVTLNRKHTDHFMLYCIWSIAFCISWSEIN